MATIEIKTSQELQNLSVESGNTYLIERGKTYNISSKIEINGKENVKFSTFGEGYRPHIIQADENSNVFYVVNSEHTTIEGLKCEMPYGKGSGVMNIAAHGTGTNHHTFVNNCEIVGGWRGINTEVFKSEYNAHISDIKVTNTIIHNQTDDGFFAKPNNQEFYNNIELNNCIIYDTNLKWFDTEDKSQCGGDPVHILRGNNVKVINCILDKQGVMGEHAGTGWKFCFAWTGAPIGQVADYVEVKDCIMFAPTYYPEHSGFPSNGIYVPSSLKEFVFTGNMLFGDGSQNAIGIARADKNLFEMNKFIDMGYLALGVNADDNIFNYNFFDFQVYGSTNYIIATGNNPTILNTNTFYHPAGSSVYNDGSNGGQNVFEAGNYDTNERFQLKLIYRQMMIDYSKKRLDKLLNEN